MDEDDIIRTIFGGRHLERETALKAAAAAVDPQARAKDLRARYQIWTDPHLFAAGDLIIQHPKLRRYRFPEQGLPAIVVGTYRPKVPVPESTNGPMEFPDILIMVVTHDGEPHIYAVESCRFVPWVG